MIELKDEPLDSRIVHHLNGEAMYDGGEYDMAMNLIGTSFISPV